MIALLLQYKGWLAYGAVILTFLAGTYGVIKYEQGVGYNKAVAVYTKKELEVAKEVRAREIVLNKKLQDAQNEATIRYQKIHDLSNNLAATNNSLLNTIGKLRRSLSANSLETARKNADTGLELFGECTKRYADLAEKADGYVADLKLYEQAWPTN